MSFSHSTLIAPKRHPFDFFFFFFTKPQHTKSPLSLSLSGSKLQSSASSTLARSLSRCRPSMAGIRSKASGSSSSSSEQEAPRRSRGLTVEGVAIEGLSIGGHETCVIFPTMNLAFDIGRCPQRAISQDFLFISHAHMDHIVTPLIALYMYIYGSILCVSIYTQIHIYSYSTLFFFNFCGFNLFI